MSLWVGACMVDDIDSEDVIRFDHSGKAFAIYRSPDNEFFATDGLCTHEQVHLAGVARELARSALPVGAYTEFYWTVNARSLMNFVSLRAAEAAQREIRRYADAVETFFAEKMPVTHAAFVAAGRVAP